MNKYSNIPSAPLPDQNSVENTAREFNNFYSTPTQLEVNSLNAMKGFFESKGFDTKTAENIAVVMITQSIKDNFDPMLIIDSLSGHDQASLNELAAAILNYNRYKSSYLGVGTPITPNEQISRNILA